MINRKSQEILPYLSIAIRILIDWSGWDILGLRRGFRQLYKSRLPMFQVPCMIEFFIRP